MNTAFVPATNRNFSFEAALAPAITVRTGSVVTFETDLAVLDRLAAGESPEHIGMENLNAVTGPVAIAGAEPGDALRIEVMAIDITAAWSAWLPGFGCLGHRTEGIQVRRLIVDGETLRLSDNLTVPLAPMIGCIGTAPATGRGSTLRPVSSCGGNMDLRELSPGAAIWLPVEVAGGLLSLGDLHAAMGQGEATSVAVEASGRATVRIHLEKAAAPATPRLRAGNETICIGLGADHIEARQRAMEQAYDLLVDRFQFTPFDAYAYACSRVGVRFGGPASPMVLAVVPDP